MEDGNGWQQQPEADGDLFAAALAELVAVIRTACDPADEWPQRVGAGLHAALGYLAEEPRRARALLDNPSTSRFGEPFRRLVQTMSELLDEAVPLQARPAPQTPAAALAGVALVVGDCVRFGRLRQLPDLSPELHLMILIPFLDFGEAKFYAQSFQDLPLSQFRPTA